jgi:SulP family sulfate permease
MRARFRTAACPIPVWSALSLPAVMARRLKPSLRPSVPITAKLLRTEVLAGLVVALALIAEAIWFSIIAGVDPSVGLFASCTMAVTIAVVGGRPR